MATDLASIIGRTADRAGVTPFVLFVASVTSTSPLAVQASGAVVAAQRLASYTPAGADVVLVARTGGRFVILGKVV